MAILNIRKLPDHVHRLLRIRSARNGRSMEAEARAILTEICTTETEVQESAGLPTWVDELYQGKKPAGVVDSLIAERRKEGARE